MVDGKEVSAQEYEQALEPGVPQAGNGPTKTAKDAGQEADAHVAGSEEGAIPGQKSHMHTAAAGFPNLYTYVNENPWTFFDPEGLFLGVPSDTIDEEGYKAASFASTSTQRSEAGPKSAPADLRTKSEFFGRIYQTPDGKFDSTLPKSAEPKVTGNKGNISVQGQGDLADIPIPTGTKEVGTYHSHPSDSNAASPQDKKTANSRGGIMYIGNRKGVNKVTPTGVVKGVANVNEKPLPPPPPKKDK